MGTTTTLLLIVVTLASCQATYMQHPVDVGLANRGADNKLADVDGSIVDVDLDQLMLVSGATDPDDVTGTSAPATQPPAPTGPADDTTTSKPPPPTTTAEVEPVEETPVGPDDLVLVDYIIIGVTAAVLGGVIIGGTAMGCVNKKKAKQEKKTKATKQRMLQNQRLQWDNTAMQDDSIKPSRY